MLGNCLFFLASLLCTKLGFFWCALNWSRPLGVVWLVHYLFNLLGECFAAHEIACQFLEFFILGNFMHHKSYMPAFAGQPSLHGYDAYVIYWTKGALRGNRMQKYCKTSFSPFFGGGEERGRGFC